MNEGYNKASRLKGRRILFGVTGSIAVFKAAAWVRSLTREEARVSVVMTKAATRFVSGLTFAALSGERVYRGMFSESSPDTMAHITLGREADLVLVAPATAQTISRLAHGMAEDLLSAAILAARVPVVVCPAMNSRMLSHPITQENLEKLRFIGYTIVSPEKGELACGEEGAGRLADWDVVRETCIARMTPQDLAGRPVLITAGATREPLDPVRYLTNRSSGKMGYALARTAWRRGARVTLISAPVSLEPPPGVEVVAVNTANEMRQAVLKYADTASVIVSAAAVADFRPARRAAAKIKKHGASPIIDLVPNPDILAELGRNRKNGQVLVGFAAESHDHEREGARKLEEKNLDLIVVNDILGRDTGFEVNTNQVTILQRNGEPLHLPLLSKIETADRIWDQVVPLLDRHAA